MQPHPSSSSPQHSSTKGLLVLIPDKIDVEEESRFYDELCEDGGAYRPETPVPRSLKRPPSVPSSDIWLGNNSGASLSFARDVTISGWTNVGDLPGGAYVAYDCVIRTKEGTTIHTHKRYSAFVNLYHALRRTLPHDLQHYVPALPPKLPLARYRPAFLDHRRRNLQSWLSAVLLHPEVGASQAVRYWVMD